MRKNEAEPRKRCRQAKPSEPKFFTCNSADQLATICVDGVDEFSKNTTLKYFNKY